jgi:hypothetical protein
MSCYYIKMFNFKVDSELGSPIISPLHPPSLPPPLSQELKVSSLLVTFSEEREIEL